MKTIQELNAYLYALSLVNSNCGNGTHYHFEIDNIEKKESVFDALSHYEKTSESFDGYDKGKYEILILRDGFDQLTTELNELFNKYLEVTIEYSRLNLHISEKKYMLSALNDSIRENHLSESFVKSLKKLVGSDATVFSIDVEEQEKPEYWSVFDVLLGKVFLIWGEHRAYILKISGNT